MPEDEEIQVIYSAMSEPYGGYHETAVRGCGICDVRSYTTTDHNSKNGVIDRCEKGGFAFTCENCKCECALCTSKFCEDCGELIEDDNSIPYRLDGIFYCLECSSPPEE